jgi:dihydrofolate reductase
MSKHISIIVAIAENYAIGLNNELLWHIQDDLRRFKKLTTGHPVIMGRKTFLSLPKGALPQRINIVISDQRDDHFEGCIMAASIEEAIQRMDPDKENFIIGGGMIYRQFLPLANRIYLTIVHQPFEADTFFPEINPEDWIILTEEFHEAGEKNEYAHSFRILERKPAGE